GTPQARAGVVALAERAPGGPRAANRRAVCDHAASDLHGAPRDAARHRAPERAGRLARPPRRRRGCPGHRKTTLEAPFVRARLRELGVVLLTESQLVEIGDRACRLVD